MTIDDRRKKLYIIASEQQGYFTAKQAITCGYSRRLQHYHKEKGHWNEIERGFFRFSDFPASLNEDLVRWSFWSRNRKDEIQGVISHDTALAFYELSDILPSKIHLTVPPLFRKKPAGGCVLHRKILQPKEIEQREGFLITKPLKTILDIAESDIGAEHLEKALRDAFSKGIMVPAMIIREKIPIKAIAKITLALENIRKKPGP
ncbi:MAG: hypothetical protein L6420_00300 [Elusimicrobia bacterium]|nr:hypothetical protein [Elusimicrobiota bacterium]